MNVLKFIRCSLAGINSSSRAQEAFPYLFYSTLEHSLNEEDSPGADSAVDDDHEGVIAVEEADADEPGAFSAASRLLRVDPPKRPVIQTDLDDSLRPGRGR